MKLMIAGLVAMLALPGVARAQSMSMSESNGYVEVVGQSAFGNVTSQSFGLEGGVNLNEKLAVFAEFGMVRDTAPKSIGPAAQLIAVTLGAGSSYTVKQPVGFGQVGVRYTLPMDGKFHPYIAIGGGLAKLKHDVAFSVNGTDVTDKLSTYGVVLGTDLAGTVSKGMFTGGAGVVYDVTKTIIAEANYRFSRIMTDNSGTNLNRVGAGIGIRF